MTEVLGEKNHSTKLSTADVETVRQGLLEGRTGLSLARQLGVSGPTISDIKRTITWNDTKESSSRARRELLKTFVRRLPNVE